MKKKSSVLINILLVLAGGVCLYFGFQQASSNACDWPTTPGQVVSSEISVNYGSDTSDNEYVVEVHYAYAVDRAGQTASFSHRFVSQSDANDEQELFSPGKVLTVYYDPQDPGTATLNPREHIVTGYIGIATGIILLAIDGWGMRVYFVHRSLHFAATF
jgi:hypothetical protein